MLQITKCHEKNVYMGSSDQIQFLSNLVRAIGARKVLEIGVFKILDLFNN